MKKKSDLPFGSEFSPSQIDLPGIIELAKLHNGHTEALEKAIMERYFAQHGGGSAKNRRTLAMNCRLGMKAYGLIDDHGSLTPLGEQLYNVRRDPSHLYVALAKQILLNLRGMALVQCIQDMTAAGEEIKLTTLRDALAVRGIHYPPGGKHPSMMRLWLEKAGVFVGSRWQIDERRVQEMAGVGIGALEELQCLSREQRAFLLSLANTGIADAQSASDIVKLASAVYGVKFPEKSLPRIVLDGLVSSGYIEVIKTTTGRGAKPFLVKPTRKLNLSVLNPLLQQCMPPGKDRMRALLRMSLKEILTQLDDQRSHIRGLALEALAFKLMRLLDMKYVATRLRGQATGGAEVDLIFESERLVYSRWQVQCKNTRHMSLDDVAKEVGLTHLLKSMVIVLVCTGDIGQEARRYANKIMADSNLCLVMLDGRDLIAISSIPAAIVDLFNREAHHAMTLKKLSYSGMGDE